MLMKLTPGCNAIKCTIEKRAFKMQRSQIKFHFRESMLFLEQKEK